MTAAVAFALGVSGCATKPERAAAPELNASATPAPVVRLLVGQIAIVDAEQRFVLVDLGSNLYVPSPGMTLESSNAAGETTATLKAAPEQNRPFIVADIIAGSPQVGDQVFR